MMRQPVSKNELPLGVKLPASTTAWQISSGEASFHRLFPLSFPTFFFFPSFDKHIIIFFAGLRFCFCLIHFPQGSDGDEKGDKWKSVVFLVLFVCYVEATNYAVLHPKWNIWEFLFFFFISLLRIQYYYFAVEAVKFC